MVAGTKKCENKVMVAVSRAGTVPIFLGENAGSTGWTWDMACLFAPESLDGDRGLKLGTRSPEASG